MHELEFARRIAREVRGKVKKKLVIGMGELLDFHAHELEEAFKLLLPGIEVEVRELPSKVKCRCGYEGRAKLLVKEHGFVLFTCPKCGAVPRVIEGREIKVLEIL